MKKCKQCRSDLYHHICYNCGWDDALPFGIEKTYVDRITAFVETNKYKGTKCKQCNNGLYHHVCGWCGWNNKTNILENETRGWRTKSKPKKEKSKTRQYTALAHPVNNNYGVPQWVKARPSYAKFINKHVTSHEQMLYELLSDKGIIFEFEKAFENRERICTVDFYLETESGKFIIELDGTSHRVWKEKERTDWLIETWGIQDVWRYGNNQLYNNPFLILEDIERLNPEYYNIPIMPQI